MSADKAAQDREMKAVQECMWAWLGNNLHQVFSYNPNPRQIHQRTGRLGNAKSTKGKPMWGRGLHPDFERYLNTPTAIRDARSVFDALYERNRELYTYAYLRADGATHRAIDNMALLSGNLTKDNRRKETNRLRRYRRIVTQTFLSGLPNHLVRKWGLESAREALLNSKTHIPKRERMFVTCPRCSGTNRECLLCRRQQGWDGKVKKRWADKWLAGKWKDKEK